MKLARGFSRQHRIIHFTTIGSASGLTLVRGTDLPTPRATPLPRDNHRPGWTTFLRHPITYLLPPRVTGSTTPTSSEDSADGFTGLASEDSILGASKRVPEYQPVVHRLRLSASP